LAPVKAPLDGEAARPLVAIRAELEPDHHVPRAGGDALGGLPARAAPEENEEDAVEEGRLASPGRAEDREEPPLAEVVEVNLGLSGEGPEPLRPELVELHPSPRVRPSDSSRRPTSSSAPTSSATVSSSGAEPCLRVQSSQNSSSTRSSGSSSAALAASSWR